MKCCNFLFLLLVLKLAFDHSLLLAGRSLGSLATHSIECRPKILIKLHWCAGWTDSPLAHSHAFLCPATRKWRGIMLYPPKFWVSVRPSVCLSVRPSVRPSVSAHHHSCIGNSSYSFRPILLKLYRCFKDGLKICILFFQNPEIIFYHFFPIFMPRHQKVAGYYVIPSEILSVRPSVCLSVRPSAPTTILVSATPPTVLGQSFWNFTGVLRMVWRYAYCFFRILKLFFITFFPFLT